jgi:recombination protein RecT
VTASTAVAKRDEAVKGTLEVLDRPQFQAQLREALPPSVSVERFTRTAKLAVQLNPDLIEVQDKQSIFTSLVRCAFDGLIPDGRQAALVKVKERGKEKVAYWPMVGGLRFIAANHGYSLESHCVYSNDTFAWELGFEPKVTHTPPSLDEDRGDLIGAYAVATRLEDGRKFLDVMSKGEIEAIRAKSPSARFDWSPWNQSTSEMYRKTAAKRLFKQLPLGDIEEREQRVMASDGEVDEATANVPALANLPDVDPEIEEVEGEVVDEDELQELA